MADTLVVPLELIALDLNRHIAIWCAIDIEFTVGTKVTAATSHSHHMDIRTIVLCVVLVVLTVVVMVVSRPRIDVFELRQSGRVTLIVLALVRATMEVSVCADDNRVILWHILQIVLEPLYRIVLHTCAIVLLAVWTRVDN